MLLLLPLVLLAKELTLLCLLLSQWPEKTAPAGHLPHDRPGGCRRVRLQLLRQAPEARAARVPPQRGQHLLRMRVRVLPAAARLLRRTVCMSSAVQLWPLAALRVSRYQGAGSFAL